MKRKKAQVTIFMILGLVMLFTAMLMLMVTKNVKFKIETQENIPVRNFVQTCLEITGDTAVDLILLQGGSYEKGSVFNNPEIYKLAKPVNFGAGLKKIEENKGYEFSKINIEKSIEIFFNDTFDSCIKNFTDFKQKIEFENYTLKAVVGDNAVLMLLDFPIRIKKTNGEEFFNTFTYSKKINFDLMNFIVNQIVKKSIEFNFPPYELMDTLENNIEIKIIMEFVFEDSAIENIIYTINFEEDNQIINFDIHYDWYKR